MDRIVPRRLSSSCSHIVVWLAMLTPLAPAVPAQEGVAYLFETSRMELARHDLATGTRQAVTQGLGFPRQVAVRGRVAWVVEESSGELSTVNLDTGAITTVATGLGQPFGLALQPATGNQQPQVAFVAEGLNLLAGRLLAVDVGTGQATTVATGLSWGRQAGSREGGNIAIGPDGTTVYAPQAWWPGGVIAIDLATGTPHVVAGTEFTRVDSITLSPDGHTLYFSADGLVWTLDLTNPMSQAVPTDLGGSAGAFTSLAFSTDGTRLACIFVWGPSIYVFDTSSPLTPINWVFLNHPNPGGVTFHDRDTVLFTDSAAIMALDVPTGAVTVVDAGLHNAIDLDVVGMTAYLRDNPRTPTDAFHPGLPVQSDASIVSVDLATGRVSTIVADAHFQGYGGLCASNDGSHLYFLRHNNQIPHDLVGVDLATGIANPVALLAYSPLDLALDDSAGCAYVSQGSGLSRIDLATGLTTNDFWAPAGVFHHLHNFGVDPANGRVVGSVYVPGYSSNGLGVIDLIPPAQLSLVDFVPFQPPRGLWQSQPSPDGRSVYSVVSAGNQFQLIKTDMISPAHPQSTLLTVDQYVSAMCVLNTADGPNVVATPVDSVSGASPVTLTFDNVVGAGDTTLATSPTGPAVPAGFQLGGAGVYYEIGTTAEFTGTVEICIDYSGTTFVDENTLQLLHWDNGTWVNVTTTRDPATNQICGVVQSFSPFVVVEWPAMSDLNDLVNRVHNLDVRHGIVVSLDAKLAAVQQALGYTLQGNQGAAVNCLRAFIQAVLAQSGQNLPVETANGLIADAEAIITLLGG